MDGILSSLPMYDLPELRPQTAALWQALAVALRAAGVAAPDELSSPDALAAHWRQPDLLLSQTCGYPLLSLPEHVRVVATPAYTAPGCEGAWYRSALVVHRDNPAADLEALRGGVCALNNPDSNSGMNLLRATIAPLAGGRPFFRDVVVTGGHAASLAAVGGGTADLAAIDCVTLALLQANRPALTAPMRVLGWTPAAPGLPLITAGDASLVEKLREALAVVAADPALAAVRRALLIDRFVVLPGDAYEVIRQLEHDAEIAGYPVLA
ncbi:phosphate/phosphite/phosphonate ABC transporter substrate-binding protein [Lichenicola sp.]|uniref:phosphate/phosphite/phosphonate ABC transporter substrate-binding protein n=1 Tax=Lichenicola sp. TaxID=2804529 RepID=UPI003B004AD9